MGRAYVVILQHSIDTDQVSDYFSGNVRKLTYSALSWALIVGTEVAYYANEFQWQAGKHVAGTTWATHPPIQDIRTRLIPIVTTPDNRAYFLRHIKEYYGYTDFNTKQALIHMNVNCWEHRRYFIWL